MARQGTALAGDSSTNVLARASASIRKQPFLYSYIPTFLYTAFTSTWFESEMRLCTYSTKVPHATFESLAMFKCSTLMQIRSTPLLHSLKNSQGRLLKHTSAERCRKSTLSEFGSTVPMDCLGQPCRAGNGHKLPGTAAGAVCAPRAGPRRCTPCPRAACANRVAQLRWLQLDTQHTNTLDCALELRGWHPCAWLMMKIHREQTVVCNCLTSQDVEYENLPWTCHVSCLMTLRCHLVVITCKRYVCELS